jgi:hypothetical protein
MRSLPWIALVFATGAIAQSSSNEYLRLRSATSDACLNWSKRTFVYTLDAEGSRDAPGDTEFAAIDAAFATWQAVSNLCSDFTFVRGEVMPNAPFGYDHDSPVNHNVVLFRHTNCNEVDIPAEDPCWNDKTCGDEYGCWAHLDEVIAWTVASYTKQTGTIVDADIELNAARQTYDQNQSDHFLFTTVNSPPCSEETGSSPSCVAYDIQNTMTHEIGHAVGFAHVNVRGSTMAPTAELGETSKRILDSGTRTGFCEIYPPGLPATTCDDVAQVTRHVLAMNEGAPGFMLNCASAGGVLAPGGAILLLALLRRRRTA